MLDAYQYSSSREDAFDWVPDKFVSIAPGATETRLSIIAKDRGEVHLSFDGSSVVFNSDLSKF
jgi:hypothetical protein